MCHEIYLEFRYASCNRWHGTGVRVQWKRHGCGSLVLLCPRMSTQTIFIQEELPGDCTICDSHGVRDEKRHAKRTWIKSLKDRRINRRKLVKDLLYHAHRDIKYDTVWEELKNGRKYHRLEGLGRYIGL